MIIILKYPFSEKWKKGYLVTNKEPRRNVILFNSEEDRTTISYARYLMSVYLGRFLMKHEHVDHIDHNRMNDYIENLQILSQKENSKKEAIRKGRQRAKIMCPICDKIFSIRKGNSQAVPSLKGKISCCGKRCSNILKKMKLSEYERNKISEKSLLEIYTEHK
jgi:uncharacterized C2H2 Zn-finger protein